MIAGKVSEQDMGVYNDAAYKNYNEKALDACPNCRRTFLPDRLIVHLKSCKSAGGKGGNSNESSPTRGSIGQNGNSSGGSGGIGGSGMARSNSNNGSP